eukprot:SAG31_NODE_40561_length_280_cov_0.574586_1_plen_59_part_10
MLWVLGGLLSFMMAAFQVLTMFKVVPSLHVAIQKNLTTHKAVRQFHERLMLDFAGILLF